MLRPDEERQRNSPWNIAANFDMDLNFSADQIEDMLKEYEAERPGMEIWEETDYYKIALK